MLEQRVHFRLELRSTHLMPPLHRFHPSVTCPTLLPWQGQVPWGCTARRYWAVAATGRAPAAHLVRLHACVGGWNQAHAGVLRLHRRAGGKYDHPRIQQRLVQQRHTSASASASGAERASTGQTARCRHRCNHQPCHGGTSHVALGPVPTLWPKGGGQV